MSKNKSFTGFSVNRVKLCINKVSP